MSLPTIDTNQGGQITHIVSHRRQPPLPPPPHLFSPRVDLCSSVWRP
eukprot:SAG11_NODE_6918_length_1225_cov_1.681172_1_plen_46_part_10